jgi:hypothetical protein
MVKLPVDYLGFSLRADALLFGEFMVLSLAKARFYLSNEIW